MNQVITARDISNREFLELYARPGRIGLAGGSTLIDRVIRRAERRINVDQKWSTWSHAFIFSERRCDGHQWVIESDLAAVRKHIRLGVQENRMGKYYDEELYGTLAILDFGLSEDQLRALLCHGLQLMSDATRYSVRELFGTLLALKKPELRLKENVLARDQSFFCSAFVQHLYHQIGLDLAPGINAKHTTPEDISATLIPHSRWVLHRELGESKTKERVRKVLARVKSNRGLATD
ncbi:MAG: hypothetical protein JWO95_1374 [Verrucomicrobiales bacterium]|nr:hypothetical protein [Verrucomicrobiales bacterium]